MKLTKHEHACVVLEKDGASIVIDPGSFSSGAAEIIAGADAILVTHEHMDHVNEAAVNGPQLRGLGRSSKATFYGIGSLDEAGFAEGYDLGVRGGVGVAEDSVLASADDFVVVDDDCAYRDFAVGFGGVGFGDGGSEVGEVSGH